MLARPSMASTQSGKASYCLGILSASTVAGLALLMFGCHKAGAAPRILHRSSSQLKLGTVASIMLAGKDLCVA